MGEVDAGGRLDAGAVDVVGGGAMETDGGGIEVGGGMMEAVGGGGIQY